MSAATITLEVASRFDALRRRYLYVRIATVFAAATALAMAVWLTLAAADYLWEWPQAIRQPLAVAAAAAIAAAAAWGGYRAGRESSPRRFVTAFEGRFQQFGQRMRTVLDIARGRSAGAQSMVAALANQTLGRWETVDVREIVPQRRLVWVASAAAASLLLAAGVWGFGGEGGIAMRRALGSDIPYTTLRVVPGDAIILEGQPAVIELQLLGRGGREVALRYRSMPAVGAAETAEDETAQDETAKDETAGDKTAGVEADSAWIEVGLQPDEPSDSSPTAVSRGAAEPAATYSLSLPRMVEPIEYQFVTSVGDTRLYRLDVRPLIKAVSVATVVQPPEYTRLEQRSYQSRQLTVLRGSKVEVHVTTSHPLRSMQLKIGPKSNRLTEVDADRSPQSEDGIEWVFNLPAEDSLHWQVEGIGDLDTPMTPARGRLRVRRDDPPALVWQEPTDQIKVHTLAEVPLRLQVSDDYGVTAASIAFQLGDEEFVLAELDPAAVEAGGDQNTKVDLSEILPLETLGLTERDYISYYAFAVDNRGDVPQRSESDIRYIDIRPLRQYYSEIERDPNLSGSGRLLVQLDEIIRRERFLINRTRKLPQQAQSLSPLQLNTVDILVANQSELAGLTRSLTEFLVSRGNDDVDALNQAEASMLQAADALAAANFPLALTQEQDALRSLAEARRTLEIFLLKNPSPAQQMALRRFAEQLAQKLRRQRPQSQQQLADSLTALAREERQLGEFAAAISRRGDAELPSESEAAADSAAGDALDDAAVRPPETADDVRSRQIELLERLEAINSQLGDDPARTDLFDQRMEEATDEMDRMAGLAREGSLEPFSQAAPPLADLLEELAEQLEALAAVEPVDRVAALRDMMTSLANMEQQRSQPGSSRMSGDSAGRGGNGSRGEDGQRGEDGEGGDGAAAEDAMRNEREGERDGDDPKDDERGEDPRQDGERRGDTLDEQEPGELGSGETDDEPRDEQGGAAPDEASERLAAAIGLRAATVRDVLQMPAALGDVEASQITEELQRFAEENEILDLLEASQSTGAGQRQASMQRATDYAQAAFQLAELYRRSVAPELARLRRLEQQASQLAAKMGAGNGADPQATEAVGVKQLRQSLQAEGLEDIAELLEPVGEGQSDPPLDSGMDDPISISSANVTGSSRSLTTVGSPSAQVQLVASRLRERIQELMLRELAADRNAAVPLQYREAVDRYFRSLTVGEPQ